MRSARLVATLLAISTIIAVSYLAFSAPHDSALAGNAGQTHAGNAGRPPAAITIPSTSTPTPEPTATPTPTPTPTPVSIIAKTRSPTLPNPTQPYPTHANRMGNAFRPCPHSGSLPPLRLNLRWRRHRILRCPHQPHPLHQLPAGQLRHLRRLQPTRTRRRPHQSLLSRHHLRRSRNWLRLQLRHRLRQVQELSTLLLLPLRSHLLPTVRPDTHADSRSHATITQLSRHRRQLRLQHPLGHLPSCKLLPPLINASPYPKRRARVAKWLRPDSTTRRGPMPLPTAASTSN